MSDEEHERERRWDEDAPPPEDDDNAPHDDIMKRLLNYQRSLREGASPEEAADAVARTAGVETSPREEEVLDLSSDEGDRWPAEPEPAEANTPETPSDTPEVAEPDSMVRIDEPSAPPLASGPPPEDAQTRELKERLASLEARLDRLGTKLGDLRKSFQDLAIAADERLASIEDEIAEARRDLPGD